MLASLIAAAALLGADSYELLGPDDTPAELSYMLCDRPRVQRSARVRALQAAAVAQRELDNETIEVRYWVQTGTRRAGLFRSVPVGYWDTQTMSKGEARAFNQKTCAEKRLAWMRKKGRQ